MSLRGILDKEWQIAVPTQEDFNMAWKLLVTLGVPVSSAYEERSWKGSNTVIKYNSTSLRYMWASIVPSNKPRYESIFKFTHAKGIEVPKEKPTMNDVIRLAELDQEGGMIQANIDNVKEQLAALQYSLELNDAAQKVLKKKLDVSD